MAACFLRTREFGDCGEFRGITYFVSLDHCNNDLSQHLSRCHLSQEWIMEGGLILARSGLFYTTEAQRGEMLFVRSTAPILGSTGESRQSQGLASTLSRRESAKQPGLIGHLLWEYQGKWWKCLVFLFLLVHVSIYHEILQYFFFDFKEARLVNNLFNERVFSSLGMIFFSVV